MRYLDNYSLLGPVQAYPDIFELFSLDTASVHMAVAANPDIIFNPLSRVEKKKFTRTPIMCGRVNPNIFESDDVAKSYPVFYQTISRYGDTNKSDFNMLRVDGEIRKENVMD